MGVIVAGVLLAIGLVLLGVLVVAVRRHVRRVERAGAELRATLDTGLAALSSARHRS